MDYLVPYLEARGYVERVPDPTDRRAKIARLTSRGWEVVEAGAAAINAIEERWADVLGPERWAELRLLFRACQSRQFGGSIWPKPALNSYLARNANHAGVVPGLARRSRCRSLTPADLVVRR